MQANTVPTLAGVLRPSRPAAGWLFDAALVVAGSALIALSARLALALPPGLSPVPVTGQSLVVLLIGGLYGSRRGAATVVAYLLEGLAGMPIFAGGAAGPLHLVGPSGGYLFGFVAAAYVVGRLAEAGWDRRTARTALAMTIGTGVLFVPGIIWLSFFAGPARAVGAGLLPFLPGAAVKIAVATVMLPQGWRLLRWMRG